VARLGEEKKMKKKKRKKRRKNEIREFSGLRRWTPQKSPGAHIARLEEEEKKGTPPPTKKKHSKKRHTHTHLVPHVARLEKEKKYEKNE